MEPIRELASDLCQRLIPLFHQAQATSVQVDSRYYYLASPRNETVSTRDVLMRGRCDLGATHSPREETLPPHPPRGFSRGSHGGQVVFGHPQALRDVIAQFLRDSESILEQLQSMIAQRGEAEKAKAEAGVE